MGREPLGAGGHQGVAFGPIPGSTPATRVYVPVDGRVHRIDVFSEGRGEEGLDADDRRLLGTLRFGRPSASVASQDPSMIRRTIQRIRVRARIRESPCVSHSRSA